MTNPHADAIRRLRGGGEQAGIIRHAQGAIGYLLQADLDQAVAAIDWMPAEKLRQVALVADALSWAAHELAKGGA